MARVHRVTSPISSADQDGPADRVSKMNSRDSEWVLDDGEGGEWFTPVSFGAKPARETTWEPTAVMHPFGRSQFRRVAENVTIPPAVLDIMLNGKDRDRPWVWPETDKEAEVSSSGRKWTPRMCGVTSHATVTINSHYLRPAPNRSGSRDGTGIGHGGMGMSPMKGPKPSGRGRALHMRAERYKAPLRRPGTLVSKHFVFSHT